MTRIHSSVLLGAGVIVFAAALLLWIIPVGVDSPSRVRAIVLSPSFWPNIIAVLLAIGGAILLALHFLRPATADEAALDRNPHGEMRVLAVAILMVGYYLVIPFLGMIIASGLAYLAFIAVTGLRRPVWSMIMAAALPLALYVFFNHVAGVPIPQAPFLRLP